MTALTVPGRLSTGCLNVSGGMAAHSSCRAIARAVSDVEHWGLEQNWCSNSSHMCSMGFRLGLCAGQSISGTVLSTTATQLSLRCKKTAWQNDAFKRYQEILSLITFSSCLCKVKFQFCFYQFESCPINRRSAARQKLNRE
jgi:hypothetical protein